MTTKRFTVPVHEARCGECGQRTAEECSRAECGNRRHVTANVPDGSESPVWLGEGCSYRARLGNGES